MSDQYNFGYYFDEAIANRQCHSCRCKIPKKQRHLAKDLPGIRVSRRNFCKKCALTHLEKKIRSLIELEKEVKGITEL